MLSFQSEFFTLQNSNKINVSVMTWKSKVITARPRDTRILVPEKNRAAQNRASWGLYLCTKWDFFTKNRVSSRLLFKIRASWGYTYVLKGIFIDFFLAYLAIGTFFNWDLLSWFNLIKVACIASGWFRPPVFIIKTKFVLFRACWK